MTIKYEWENMKVNVEGFDYNHRWSSPHTHSVIQDVEYEYEVEPTDKDIQDFCRLTDTNFNGIEELEENEEFIWFIKERYEQDALEQWGDSNDAY